MAFIPVIFKAFLLRLEINLTHVELFMAEQIILEYAVSVSRKSNKINRKYMYNIHTL